MYSELEGNMSSTPDQAILAATTSILVTLAANMMIATPKSIFNNSAYHPPVPESGRIVKEKIKWTT